MNKSKLWKEYNYRHFMKDYLWGVIRIEKDPLKPKKELIVYDSVVDGELLMPNSLSKILKKACGTFFIFDKTKFYGNVEFPKGSEIISL